MMKCLLLGTALALATLPVHAQDVEWKLYGTLMVFVDNVKTTGASAGTVTGNDLVATYAGTTNLPARNRMTWGTSNLGFRGSYKLNPNLKAIWQYESSASLDGDAPNVWGGRNCGLGLAGDSWGQVLIGSWDTPYKWVHMIYGPLRGLQVFEDPITSNPGFNTPVTVTKTTRDNSISDASFNRRQGNSIQYWTPSWSGVSARLLYSINEGKQVSDAATAVAYNPTVVSALLTYKTGDLALHYSYEQHRDYYGLSQLVANLGSWGTTAIGGAATVGNPHSKDEGHQLSACYTIAATGTRVNGLVEQLKFHNDDTVAAHINDYKRLAWTIGVQQTIVGPHRLWLNYSQAKAGDATRVDGSTASTDGLSAKYFNLGYTYAVTKSFDVYAAYYTILNDKAACYQSSAPAIKVSPGADTRAFGVGALYTF